MTRYGLCFAMQLSICESNCALSLASQPHPWSAFTLSSTIHTRIAPAEMESEELKCLITFRHCQVTIRYHCIAICLLSSEKLNILDDLTGTI